MDFPNVQTEYSFNYAAIMNFVFLYDVLNNLPVHVAELILSNRLFLIFRCTLRFCLTVTRLVRLHFGTQCVVSTVVLLEMMVSLVLLLEHRCDHLSVILC